MLADEVNIGKDTMRKTVLEDLRKWQICSCFIPHSDSRAEKPSHNATIIKQFLGQLKVTVLNQPPYLPDLAPADYFFPQK
jgi:hypothetical protein